MEDKTVAIGALAIAALSTVSGLLVGIAGGVVGGHGPVVPPPPLTSAGLQSAGLYGAEPATYSVVVPPTPTWKVADPITPRNIPITIEPTTTTAAATTTAATATTTTATTTPIPVTPSPPRATISRPPVVPTTANPAPRAAAEPPAVPTTSTTTTTTTRPVITIPPITTKPQR